MVTITVTKFGESQNPSPNLVKKIALFYSQYTLVFLPRCFLDVLKMFSGCLQDFPGCFQDAPMGLVGLVEFDDC